MIGQWLFGIPMLAGLGASGFAAFLTARNIEVIMPNHPKWSVVLSGVLAAFGAFVITEIVVFVTKLVKVPAEIDYAKNTQITKLEKELRIFTEPSLFIDYRPKEGEPFVQDSDGVTQYRISIRSPVPTTDVELVANRVKTGNYEGLSNLHLRPMHDRNSEGTKRIAVKADKEAWWDLVSIHPEGGLFKLYCFDWREASRARGS